MKQLRAGEMRDKHTHSERTKNSIHIYVMPDVIRVIPQGEYTTINRYCVDYMKQNMPAHYAVPEILTLIRDLAKVCILIGKPEGMIQTTSPLYQERGTNERTYRDMTDEAVQKLTQLPRYQAYAKLIDEVDDRQIVRTHKIQTHPLPAIQSMETELQAIANGHTLGKKRDEIDAEIRERQSRWGLGGSPPQTKRLQD